MNIMKPIETAPKDGRKILTYGTLPASYGYSDDDHCYSISYWCGTGWISQRSQSFGNRFIPAAWCELPDPPNSQTKSQP